MYVAYASPEKQPENYNTIKATQWFVVSDLGITSMTGSDGLHVFIRSLTAADPVQGTKVRVIARNNEILANGVTDDKGYIRFDRGLINGDAALSPHLIIAERSEGDYAFLDITRSAFDFTDRGVAGRTNSGPLDAYIYAERGVYRTGENVFLTALLRDKVGNAVPKIPLTLKIRRPDGVEHTKQVLNDEGDGGRSYILEIPNNAMSGTWSAYLHSDPKSSSIGSTTFLVEDYVPQRMELKLASDDKVISANKEIQISASGRFLYGAPASSLELNGEVLVRKKNQGFKGFEDYQFGNFDEKFLNINKPLRSLPKTDNDGKANIITGLPEIKPTSKPLEALVTLRLNEPGRSINCQAIKL